VVPYSLELFSFKLAGNVLLDDVVNRLVELLRIIGIGQKSQLDLFLFDFSQLPKEIPL